jgi:hypothetical protein
VDPEPTASTKDVPRSDTPSGEVTDARNATSHKVAAVPGRRGFA